MAVEARGTRPPGVYPARLDDAERLLRDEREDAEYRECEDQLEGDPELAERGPGVNVGDGAREHPDLAYPVEGPGPDRRQPHGEVDDEERERRRPPQREQGE